VLELVIGVVLGRRWVISLRNMCICFVTVALAFRGIAVTFGLLECLKFVFRHKTGCVGACRYEGR